MNILVTGAAGFIGYHVAAALLDQGHDVVGLDNLNTYYDVALKEARLALLEGRDQFAFHRLDLGDKQAIADLFATQKLDRVVHLGAQAGVRYSLSNPHAYVDSNMMGTLNILEGCRLHDVEHLVFASSSSVYGANAAMPFSEHHNVDHPVSLYAASKKANELMAHSYSAIYRLPVTGLRFFTVYGPWGRPDMALFLFTKSMLAGKPIQVFNNGDHERDFTYIDDIVDGVLGVIDRIPGPDEKWSAQQPDPASSFAPYRIYNIGNGRPVALLDFIACLEKELGVAAKKEFVAKQPGDVDKTFADIGDLSGDTGYQPKVGIETGIKRFVDWYRAYYGV